MIVLEDYIVGQTCTNIQLVVFVVMEREIEANYDSKRDLTINVLIDNSIANKIVVFIDGKTKEIILQDKCDLLGNIVASLKPRRNYH